MEKNTFCKSCGQFEQFEIIHGLANDGQPKENLTILEHDHKQPWFFYKNDQPENIALLCRKCHRRKSEVEHAFWVLLQQEYLTQQTANQILTSNTVKIYG